ncbi:GNAT family N-acetyltransferase [Candidatus Berkiella aquae]|uniref:Aminoglycoside N(6')-acetyltransferase type 1 n=1 Tax=Candidatus Berkiella aquae TaxID=295108 RepID=A0A0Q9YNR4_9GAMM|nr:GNAT family N-acetyltransferase [Candidatus Berkiella aquae]MCS5712351.1 GNAT family N-acetyltransferase [Candidatus Berkiella aquae]
MIIFLNGTSSAGKSTLARKIMRQSARPFLYYSIDHLVNYWIDEKFVAFENEPRDWFFHEFSLDDNGNPLTHIVDGPNAIQLHWDMIDALAVLIQKGYDLIIDEVLWDEKIFARYADALCFANRVYIVKVACELLECERRESDREDRFKGMARALYNQVYYQELSYDLEVDTTATQPEQLASVVVQFVENHKTPQAFYQYLYKHITFTPLTVEHFDDLFRWLNAEHVRQWWPHDSHWTQAAIQQKYETYVQGYKTIDNTTKPIHAFVIECAKKPIGYIQFYDVNDFPRDGYELVKTKDSVAALDMYIGEVQYLNKNIAAVAIAEFMQMHIKPNFAACFVDPDSANFAAIRTYEKCGFRVMKTLEKPSITCMLKQF